MLLKASHLRIRTMLLFYLNICNRRRMPIPVCIKHALMIQYYIKLLGLHICTQLSYFLPGCWFGCVLGPNMSFFHMQPSICPLKSVNSSICVGPLQQYNWNTFVWEEAVTSAAPPSLPVVYGSAVGSHISLPFDGDTHDSWPLVTVCFHYASSSARRGCITVSCKASRFGPKRGERIRRGEFFWHYKKQRGLVRV